MRVQVKLFATLRKYMPAGKAGDTVTVDVPEDATVGDLVARLGIPAEHARMAVAAGEQLDLAARLPPGVEINLFPPLAGGA
ncbi:MoaD/ThiS family protein [bacterium]|nr:MoaD/ThiS family protein [bacterium]